MRKILFSLAIICLIIFIGCLGTGTSGDVVGPSAYFKDAMLSGKVYFEDRQLYGGIPISVRYSGSPQENIAATLYTDNGGYFYLTYLEPGIYDLAAVTGESEVIFARGVQIVENVNRQINETALLCISDIIISNVEKDSFKISFHSNMGARSTLSYSNANGPSQTITINSSPSLLHEITINDLRQETQYELSLMLTSTTGQTFTMKGLNVNTAKIVGPNNMTISINNGAFETYSSAVNVYLNANNAKFMRFGETSDLSDSVWVSYSQTYTHTFSSMSEGTKRLFVQFKDEDGNISPVQSDSILLTTSGYVGVWLNGGETLTNNTQVTLRAIYPEATHIIVSNTPNFLNSYWETYSEQRFWKLSEEDGTKKVYVRFKGGNADENKIFTASIELDTTPPNVTMEINNGNEFTATTSVNLNFSYLGSPPSHMKISNTEAPENTSPWIEYQNPYSWTIPREDGEKTVYAIFKDTAGNEYGPVTAVITLDQTPPEGSSISIMSSSLADATKITSTTVNNLPIYLAFDITDDSVYKIYYAITSADADEPPIEQFTELNKPFVSVEIREGKQIVNGYFAAGNYKFWAYFADIADNRGYIQTANLYVDGPKITISPSSVNLTSGGRQTFTYSLENITTADTGTILWSVEPPTAGTITNNGIFTAKMPILEVSTANIIASSTNNVKYLQRAVSQVILNTKMEVLYENASGAYIIEGKRYSYDPITINLENGGVATATIIMLHSDHGDLGQFLCQERRT